MRRRASRELEITSATPKWRSVAGHNIDLKRSLDTPIHERMNGCTGQWLSSLRWYVWWRVDPHADADRPYWRLLEEVQSADEPDCGLEFLTGQVLPIHGSLKRCQGPKNWPRRGGRRVESVRSGW